MAGLFKAVLEISVSASVLILLTLGARLLISRKPGVILPLLSVLILVRLAVPVNIPSPLSIQNLFAGIQLGQPVVETVATPEEPGVSVAPDTGEAATGLEGIPAESSVVPVNDGIPTHPVSHISAPSLSFMDVCALIWIAGMVLMSVSVVVSNIRFSRLLRKNRAYDALGFDELLGQCKHEMGIRRTIETVQVSEVNTAAVYGVFRPRLLISPSFGWLSEDEKRHVLLHELSHIKRWDTALALLMTILNIVHWFNPLVWAALALARKDIETMCDLAVLRRTEDRLGYARTLLSLAKTTRNTSLRLGTALFMWRARSGHIGVLVSTYSIKRRIKMVARYKKSPALTAFALLLVFALAVTGCTAAVDGDVLLTPNEPSNTEAVESVQPTPKPTETPEQNSETINSLIERMQGNKTPNSVEGFTGGSTVIDVVDKIGANNIKTAVLSYKSELLGYPAVVKYIFDNSVDDTLSLNSMLLYIIPEHQSGYKRQLQNLANKLEAELGEHEPGGEYPNYKWKGNDYSVALSSEGDFSSSGVLATVHLFLFNGVAIPGIFQDIVAGTDIGTVYGSETPVQGLGELTDDPSLYYVYYTDQDTPVTLSFEVQGTEIKLCQVFYDALLVDAGYEDMKQCFRSFGDSMEDELGPATSRNDSPSEDLSRPALIMNWPGLVITAYYDTLHENYYIDTLFTKEYFTAK